MDTVELALWVGSQLTLVEKTVLLKSFARIFQNFVSILLEFFRALQVFCRNLSGPCKNFAGIFQSLASILQKSVKNLQVLVNVRTRISDPTGFFAEISLKLRNI